MTMHHPRMFSVCITLTILCVSCGLTDYERKDNRPISQSSESESLNQDCSLTSTVFLGEIKPIIEGQCIRCHVPGGIGNFPFIPEQDAANQQIFAELLGGDSEALIAKTSGRVSHGGGNQLLDGDAERIRLFFSAVDLCK